MRNIGHNNKTMIWRRREGKQPSPTPAPTLLRIHQPLPILKPVRGRLLSCSRTIIIPPPTLWLCLVPIIGCFRSVAALALPILRSLPCWWRSTSESRREGRRICRLIFFDSLNSWIYLVLDPVVSCSLFRGSVRLWRKMVVSGPVTAGQVRGIVVLFCWFSGPRFVGICCKGSMDSLVVLFGVSNSSGYFVSVSWILGWAVALANLGNSGVRNARSGLGISMISKLTYCGEIVRSNLFEKAWEVWCRPSV